MAVAAHPDIDALDRIERSDPAGGESEPTAEDYDRHRTWAIDTFGERVWAIYQREPWALHGLTPV